MSHSFCYNSMRKMVSGRESVGKKYEGSEGVELNEIKQQHNLLYSWGNLMAKSVKDSGIKKWTDGNVWQWLKFMRIMDKKIHLYCCQWNVVKSLKMKLKGTWATTAEVYIRFHSYQPQSLQLEICQTWFDDSHILLCHILRSESVMNPELRQQVRLVGFGMLWGITHIHTDTHTIYTYQEQDS